MKRKVMCKNCANYSPHSLYQCTLAEVLKDMAKRHKPMKLHTCDYYTKKTDR